MEPTTLATIISSCFGIIDKIFKGKETPDTITLKRYILEIESSNSSLREENLRLKEENMNLMNEISQYDKWQEERKNYESVTLESGAIVYEQKNTGYQFCPTCFVNSHIPIHLQPHPNKTRTYKICPKCKTEILLKKNVPYYENQAKADF